MQIPRKIALSLLATIFILASCKDSDDPTPAGNVTANAGADQQATVGETVTLDGSASASSDEKPLTYLWEITKKPANSTAALSDPAVANPSFVPDREGEYQLSLTVANGAASHSDHVVIMAKHVPVVLSSVSTRTVLYDRTSDPALADYWVNNDIGVDAELVITPGVTIAFAEDATLWVNDNGVLTAKGEANNKITFTGKANTQGYWRGLMFYSGSNLNELSHTEILNAGSIDMVSGVGAAITVADGARLSIKNSTVAGSSGYGLHYMEGSLITGFANNTISNNHEAPVVLTADHVGKLDAASSFSNGNGRNAIEIVGSTLTGTSEVVWAAFNDNTPYRFTDVIAINTGWKLSPGATIEVAPNSYFEIGDKGYIHAVGTPAKRIRITGVEKAGPSWDGIVIYTQSNSNVFENADIEYAGNNALLSGVRSAFFVLSGSFSMTHSTVNNSGGHAIFYLINDVTVNADLLTSNSFLNNTYEDVVSE